MNATIMTQPISTVTSEVLSTTLGDECILTVSCDKEDLSISAAVVAFAVLAFLENTALAIAILVWKLADVCKMFWFLWHLAVADGLLAVSFIYFHITVIMSCPFHLSCGRQNLTEFIVILVMFFGNILSSHLFVLAATLDRFVAIQWPFRYSTLVTWRRARIVSVLIWTFSFLIPIIGGIGIRFGSNSVAYSVTTLTAAAVTLTAAAVVIALNCWMVKLAVTSIASRPLGSSSGHRRSTLSVVPDLGALNESLKPVTTLALFVLSFIVSCAPWSVALVVCEEVKKCAIKQHQDYTLVLVLFHAIVIPFIYGFRVQEIKSRAVNFWKRTFSRAPQTADVSV